MQFSVLMSIYAGDKAEYIVAAIESILNQTVMPSDIVIVIDGPVSDIVNDKIEKYELRSDFQVVRLEKNKGLGNALRVGMKYTRFDYVARMDADDISCPNRFEKQLAVAKVHPEYSVIGGIIEEFDDRTKEVIGKRDVPEFDKDIKKYMKYRCPFNHMSVLLKKADVEKAGGYLDWHFNEDYYLWVRMALANQLFYNVPSVLVKVRASREQYERRGGTKMFHSEAALQIYMYKNDMISAVVCFYNIFIRVIVQLLITNGMRSLIYRLFARK